MDYEEKKMRFAALTRKRAYLAEHGADEAKLAEFDRAIAELDFEPVAELPKERHAPEHVTVAPKRVAGRPRKAA